MSTAPTSTPPGGGIPALVGRLHPSLRVCALAIAMALSGLAIAQLRDAAWRHQDLPFELSWPMLAVAFAASEIFVVHYQFRREQYTFSLMELPLALGLFFASWEALLIARLVGGGLALRFHRKQGPMKLVFNLAGFVLETSVAVVLFRLVAGPVEGPSLRAMIGTILGVIVGVVLITTCIAIAISVSEGRPERRTLRRLFGANVIVALTNVSLALVAVSVLWVSPSAGWLLLVVAGILFMGYRSYASLQQKHDDLELLYDFTRHTGRALHLDTAMRELLGQVQSVLRAGAAELIVRSARPGMPLVRTQIDAAGGVEVSTMRSDALWDRMEAGGSAIFAAAPVRDDALRAELEQHDLRDALVAPLRRNDGSLIGIMIAGNRLGELRTFTADDLKLFEALANHASVSLENRHLIERLRMEAADKEHQALHDSLTSLPNRVLFHERVDQAVASAQGKATTAAVMLLDLDRFKEVNDTLGHHNGDLLLQQVGERLRRTLRAGDTVARLGGDEFAVLLPDLSGSDAAEAAANGILAALERPFTIGELVLDVGASIGIAMWPDHGEDSTVLLQRADVAMYAAKERHGGVEVYDESSDTYSLERLALVGELRKAIENGELNVHYQPKADLNTGDVHGVEALVRWEHPRQGRIPPEDIIRIAEQTGLIRPLTLWVLSQTLRQCRTWLRAGRELKVAVNLSARGLLDAELPNHVLALLREVALPPGTLTFEITESSILADPVRAADVINRLRAVGVCFAIDDFGTGYSSFSQLRRLQVDEIKIDRSFVMDMMNDESDRLIVQSIVDLGRNLKLQVVAEGVEDRETWQALARMGCDDAQGYVLTQPLPAGSFLEWLVGYEAQQPQQKLGDLVVFPSPAVQR